MTEADWRSATNPTPMLEFLRNSEKASDRKLRLFACACCFHAWRMFQGEQRTRYVVFVSERFTDGLATANELRMARKRGVSFEGSTTLKDAFDAAVHAAEGAQREVRMLAVDDPDEWWRGGSATRSPAANRLAAEQAGAQADLLRDIFGNPFIPVRLESGWRTSNVVELAHTIYEERCFDRLPILSDALMDAGCNDETILAHCQQKEHCRGCWLLDLLLGKV